ncbi:hypothetical protein Hsar01_02931 [Haloferula sargassicola]|uniref:Uncharacterized protein n=1 Tax=Haloferula sargassicola TaxID=490096 RepID=A0ABP9USN3_9BACT
MPVYQPSAPPSSSPSHAPLISRSKPPIFLVKSINRLSSYPSVAPGIDDPNRLLNKRFAKNMKNLGYMLIAFWTCVTTCDAGLAGWLSQEQRDWTFIESVGGMRVTLKSKELDVDCDVSGTRHITKKPTIVNSGIGVRKLRWTRAGSTIRLSVVTSVFEKGMSSSCGSLDLSKVPSGSYAVEYLDPDGTTHPLGTITLP